MAQFARPSSDISNVGSWTPTPLWQQIDETPFDDADFFDSGTGAAESCEVGLSSVTDPVSSTGHTFRFRASLSGAGLSVEFKQGSTVIATYVSVILADATFQSDEYTLSGAEADAISDYAALSLRFVKLGAGTGTAKISWAEFETPTGLVPPVITAQPNGQARPLGTTATFGITATGATSYQWQKSEYPGGVFADIGGATSLSYITGAITSVDQRDQYRCNATNADGTTTSSAATLTISQHDIFLRVAT